MQRCECTQISTIQLGSLALHHLFEEGYLNDEEIRQLPAEIEEHGCSNTPPGMRRVDPEGRLENRESNVPVVSSTYNRTVPAQATDDMSTLIVCWALLNTYPKKILIQRYVKTHDGLASHIGIFTGFEQEMYSKSHSMLDLWAKKTRMIAHPSCLPD